MNGLYKFLFPASDSGLRVSLLLLSERVLLGGLLLSHGLLKVAQFSTLAPAFPDPLGVGTTTSLLLAIFAEVLCSMALIMGILHRLALIPIMFTMGMAFFCIHAGDPFTTKELAFAYMVLAVLLFLAGPGRFSLDSAIGNRLQRATAAKADGRK